MSTQSSDSPNEQDGGGMVTKQDLERNLARAAEAPSPLAHWLPTTMSHPFNDAPKN